MAMRTSTKKLQNRLEATANTSSGMVLAENDVVLLSDDSDERLENENSDKDNTKSFRRRGSRRSTRASTVNIQTVQITDVDTDENDDITVVLSGNKTGTTQPSRISTPTAMTRKRKSTEEEASEAKRPMIQPLLADDSDSDAEPDDPTLTKDSSSSTSFSTTLTMGTESAGKKDSMSKNSKDLPRRGQKCVVERNTDVEGEQEGVKEKFLDDGQQPQSSSTPEPESEDVGGERMEKVNEVVEDEIDEEDEPNDASSDNYEVEEIVAMKTVKNGKGTNTLYLVKWKNWNANTSTWEPEEHMTDASECLERFKLKRAARAAIARKIRGAGGMKAVDLSEGHFFQDHRKAWNLLRLEIEFNKALAERDIAPLFIENWRIEEGQLKHQYAFGRFKLSVSTSLSIPAQEMLGRLRVFPGDLTRCECKDECGSEACCSVANGVPKAYDENGRLYEGWFRQDNREITECGDHCRCDPTKCKQRVVQNGRKIPLVLFHEAPPLNWGLRAAEDIPMGTFVTEYVGELITDAESKDRHDTTYSFDMQEAILPNEKPFVIDALNTGNECRFINHSCEPNLRAFEVSYNKYGRLAYKIALFAMKKIAAGEQLSFDYDPDVVKSKTKNFTKCLCGAKKCRGYV